MRPVISTVRLYAVILSLLMLSPGFAAEDKPKASTRKAQPKEAPAKKTPEAGKPAPPSLSPAPVAPKVEWKPQYLKGRAYVPVEQVASYYDMQPPRDEGRSVILKHRNFDIELTRGERRIKLNKWTFYFSFSTIQHSGRMYVSTYDVRNVLDPIMRPNERRDPAQLKTVVIDPAGGGKDEGIKSPYVTEKEVTLDIALKLRDKLKAEGYEVVLTRESDAQVSEAQRQKIAEAVAGEAILISLRAGTGAVTVKGFETSTLPPAGTPATSESDDAVIDRRFFPGNINDRESLALATVLQSSAVTGLKTPDLGIKRLRFAELRDINMPAAVCRVGFLSNKEEAMKLGTPEYRETVAGSLNDAVRRYAKFLSAHMDERLEEEKKRPLRLGTVTAVNPPAEKEAPGQKIVLDVPIIAADTVNVDRSRVEVQLFLFERVEDGEIDVTLSNSPEIEWVSVLPDWKASRTEILRATYLRPPFGAAEAKAYGKREYHGFVARLIYDGRVMDETSSPQNLNRCLYYFTSVFPRR